MPAAAQSVEMSNAAGAGSWWRKTRKAELTALAGRAAGGGSVRQHQNPDFAVVDYCA